MRKWILAVAALCLLPAAAEAGLIRYDANPNPSAVDCYLTEPGDQTFGWYQVGAGSYWSSINDGGTLAYAQNTVGFNNYTFYQLSGPTVADAAEGNTNGWVMTAYIRIPMTNITPNWGIMVGYTEARNWYLVFGADADGDPIVATKDSGGGAGGGSYTLEGAGNTGYHTYELRYDPTNGRADVFVDGVERISDWLAGNTYPSVAAPYFRFGDCGGAGQGDGVCYYNLVEWYSIPEPATIGLMGMGLAAVFALRKKR